MKLNLLLIAILCLVLSKLDAQEPSTYFEIGGKMSAAGKLDSAIINYSLAAKNKYLPLQANLQISDLYNRKDDFRLAKKHCKVALKFAHTKDEKALVYHRLAKLMEGYNWKKYYHLQLKSLHYKADVKVYEAFCLFLFHRRWDKELSKVYHAMDGRFKDYPLSKLLMADITMEKDSLKAAQYFALASSLNDTSSFYKMVESKFYATSENYPKAIHLISQVNHALLVDSTLMNYYHFLKGSYYHGCKLWDKAIEAYSTDPFEPPLFYPNLENAITCCFISGNSCTIDLQNLIDEKEYYIDDVFDAMVQIAHALLKPINSNYAYRLINTKKLKKDKEFIILDLYEASVAFREKRYNETIEILQKANLDNPCMNIYYYYHAYLIQANLALNKLDVVESLKLDALDYGFTF